MLVKMSDSTDSEAEHERKRQKLNKKCRLKEREKIARQKGAEFVTQKGKLVNAKITGPDCTCRKKCMEHFTFEEKRLIIEIVYNGRSKNEKDTYLMGLIERHDVARHRPATAVSRHNSASFKYFTMKGTRRVEICRSAFLSLHALSNKVVQRLTKVLETKTKPIDMRGRHANRANKLDGAIVAKIDDHIKSFPKNEYHYSSKLITYLDAGLNVTKMYKLFITENPDLRTVVKYEYYLRHFRENYGYRFGRPQVDVCSTCEDLNATIKSITLNETAKRCAVAELLVHKRRASKFYKHFQKSRRPARREMTLEQ